MSAKPENTFIGSVHKKFGVKKPYFEKMYNPLRSGTPDVYYSGDAGQLWIEYKFIPRIPRSETSEIERRRDHAAAENVSRHSPTYAAKSRFVTMPA